MKRVVLVLLSLLLCFGCLSCGTSKTSGDTDTQVHKIGVIVYNTGDEEVIGFREYLQGYIEKNFEMVEFVYSESIGSSEEEMTFIRNCCESGVEGFMSFLTYDLQAEVELCAQYSAYYLLASGTVSEDDYESVADNPSFLGVFGPGKDAEYAAGTEMAEFFCNKQYGDRYFILSGGAPLGNEMHLQRTIGILDTLSNRYGVTLPQSSSELAVSGEAVTVEAGDLTVTVCPGYIEAEVFAVPARLAYTSGTYDVVLSVLPPSEMVNDFKNVKLGIVDSYNTRNLQLFTADKLHYVVGKYSSVVGPAFALMLNAVTGYAEEFQENGRAVKVNQAFWTSEDKADYDEKYALSTSEAMNAYNFDDLSKVCTIYNESADLNALISLAEACSYEDVIARRS